MPIRKFRTVAEMNGDRWYAPGDPELYRAIRRVWALGHRTLGQQFPPGVHKFRGVEEMNAQQKRWDDANFEAYRRRFRIWQEEVGGSGSLDSSPPDRRQ